MPGMLSFSLDISILNFSFTCVQTLPPDEEQKIARDLCLVIACCSHVPVCMRRTCWRWRC